MLPRARGRRAVATLRARIGRARLAGDRHLQLRRRRQVGARSRPATRRRSACCQSDRRATCDVMRTTLLAGLRRGAARRTSIAREAARARVRDRTLSSQGAGEPATRSRCGSAGLAFGDALPEQWGEQAARVDFFDVKGDVEALAAPLRLRIHGGAASVRCHPGRAPRVRIDGVAGRLRGRAASAPRCGTTSFRWPRWCSSCDWSRCWKRRFRGRRGLPAARRAPGPGRRRWTKRSPRRRSWTRSERRVRASSRRVEVSSIMYRGTGCPARQKKPCVLVLMQDTARTLTDADIDATVALRCA